MPTTRSGTKTSPAGGNASKPTRLGNAFNTQRKSETQKPTKRKSDASDERSDNKENHAPDAAKVESGRHAAKKSKSTPVKSKEKVTKSGAGDGKQQDGRDKGPDGRPVLELSGLEFDFDRSQLRDPRSLPGRKARPRYSSYELDREQSSLKTRLETDFYVPKVEKPKGRLNGFQKDQLFGQNALVNPIHSFHDLHVCHKGGPNGPPVYDEAGFELDYDKVDDWMHPKPYNKRKMVSGMEKAVTRLKAKRSRCSKSSSRTASAPIMHYTSCTSSRIISQKILECHIIKLDLRLRDHGRRKVLNQESSRHGGRSRMLSKRQDISRC